MLVKFINEHQILKPKNPIFANGKAYSNPTDETLRKLGYKELVVAPMPEVDNTKEAMPVYAEDGDVIKQDWEIIEYEFAQ